MNTLIRKHIVCYGWVQGVGFRYRARHAANLYGVTGWVRNDPGGSVTMEVQGTEDQIDKVIIAIGNFMNKIMTTERGKRLTKAVFCL